MLPRSLPLALAAAALSVAAGSAQSTDAVLVRSSDEGAAGPLDVDRGAEGVWQRLLKLRSTASVLYTTAHPDDEQAGLLTLLSRGEGVRTALLTLNRGEGGANAIGPELFDALGMIRTEELRLSGRYYGLDDQYFTTAVDYGYSKTYDEALRSWDRDAVIGDMVRIIRTNRPLVVISRFHGSERDGHGHHQAAGILTPEAVDAAADPSRYPEQIEVEGLRPWRVRKLYRGGIRDGETRHVEYDASVQSPWLAQPYADFGAYGLSLQRSQTQGRVRTGRGGASPFERLSPGNPSELSFFDGLDVSLRGVFDLTGESPPTGAVIALAQAARAIGRALDAFDFDDPSAVPPLLASARGSLTEAIRLSADAPEARWLLEVERRQLDAALTAALGLRLEAIATPPGMPANTPMEPPIAGDRLDVHVTLTRSSAHEVRVTGIGIYSPEGWGGSVARLGLDERDGPVTSGVVQTGVPRDAEPSRPWFRRGSIAENHYEVTDSAQIHLGEGRPRLFGTARIVYEEQRLELAVPVRTTEPGGTARRPLVVLPTFSVSATPSAVIAPPGARAIPVSVTVTSNDSRATAGNLALVGPDGWEVSPERHALDFAVRGERHTVAFEVTPPPGAARGTLSATLTSFTERYSEGVAEIRHPELGTKLLFEPAEVTIAPVDVGIAERMSVGYVMGVGDDVPAAIEQLGASVTLLEEGDLASGTLGRFDAIVIGTRAYAVRDDLVAHNDLLLEYAEAGGNLVVLYQTQEFTPESQAPFPAALPRGAEEVSEEDAPVRILAPDHALLTTPNRITESDFDDWIEQRGSKHFTEWDDAYTPLIESNDQGQEPQRGIWLSAPVGQGHYTYASIALHRQLPYAVPGAYRILANLISLGR